MHECLSARGWIEVLAGAEAGERQLETCPDCSPKRGDLAAWRAAVESCPACRETLDAEWPASEAALDCPGCLDVCARIHEMVEELEHFDPAVAAEGMAAEEMLAELVELPIQERLARAGRDARYSRWGLVQRLLCESRSQWTADVEAAHHHATAATMLADRLDPDLYHSLWVADLRAKSHAYLANVLRILGDFEHAERELLVARHHLRQGVGSGRCHAEVFSLEASLRLDQERFDEALELLEAVEAHFRGVGDTRSLARTRLKLAMVAAGQARYRDAAEACGDAAASLHPQRDRNLVLVARQNAVHYLVQAGEVGRARNLFQVLSPARGRNMTLRRKWVEGDLLRAEGRPHAALEAYQEARTGYAEDGRHYYVALIALEEALISFELGDLPAMAAMAEQASILLIKAAAKHQVLAALRTLLTAIEREAVDRALLAGVIHRVAKMAPA